MERDDRRKAIQLDDSSKSLISEQAQNTTYINNLYNQIA